mgnify:FL=1
MNKRLLLPLLALGLAACSAYDDGDVDDRTDLRAAFALTDVTAVGVTVDPDTGRRFVLDANQGIYELTEDGATLHVALSDFPVATPAVRSAFTDIAAMGNGRFALTARSFGYMLDVEADTLNQFFCYVPPMMDEEVFDQSTHTLGYDPGTGVLYSQPQTLDLLDGESIVASQVGVFDAIEGTDLTWHDLVDEEFIAGGLAVLDSETLLLGAGSRLYRYAFDSDRPVFDADLTSIGVSEIEGLAFDERTNTLLILDAATDALVELTLD